VLKKWCKFQALVKHDRGMEWRVGDEMTGRGRVRKNAGGVKANFWQG